MAETGGRMRLAARVYDEKERNRARAIFEAYDADVHSYDGLITGWGDTNVARQLMEAGFFIDASSCDKTDPLPPGKEVNVPGAADADPGAFAELIQNLQSTSSAASRPRGLLPYMNYLVRRPSTLANTSLALAARLLRRPQMDPTRVMYEVRLVGPMRPDWGKKLESIGASTASYAPPFLYRMLLTDDQARRARELDFVHAVTRYTLAETLGRSLLRKLQERRSESTSVASEEQVDLDLTVHDASQVPTIIALLRRTPGVVVTDAAGSPIRFAIQLSDPFLITLADREEVRSLEIHRPATLLVDFGREQVGVPAINAGGIPQAWDGSGETVGIVDSGIDRSHPDFAQSVKNYTVVSGATASDTVGHGTHVAGIVAGSGVSSGGKIRGIAPGAALTIVGIVDADGKPIFPSDLTAILQPALAGEAKIVNLSVGKKESNGVYDDWAQSLDAFVYRNPEVLVVVAAGNDGTATTGYPDYQTVSSPGTANNAITVGACGSVRTGFTGNWGTWDPARFPKPPVSLAAMAGPPSSPAALSSRGPTQNSTLKPDLLAPGTFILSAKASGCTMQSVAPVPNGAGGYMFLHGSSLAAPFVSGAAGVVRQYLREVMKVPNPSAALMKAILCGSADRSAQVVNPATPALNGYPDFDQGFGTLNLAKALPHRANNKTRLAFADVPNSSLDALASRQPDTNPATRSTRSYRFRVGPGAGPLRVILTWTDTPGPGVKNVMLLDVKGPGVALVGNHEYNFGRTGLFNTLKLAGIPYDTRSNVQTVNVHAPAPGDYYANVLAYNTHEIGGRQGYAVCACGDMESDLTTV